MAIDYFAVKIHRIVSLKLSKKLAAIHYVKSTVGWQLVAPDLCELGLWPVAVATRTRAPKSMVFVLGKYNRT